MLSTKLLSSSLPRKYSRRFLRFSSTEADYVVVGAGSAGCVVAARLADAGKSVILLEAGSGLNKNHLFTRLPTALSIPMHLKTFNYGFKAAPEDVLNGRRITCPRGKGVGGSSSINGMVYVRGHPLDFESWKEAGAEGWGWQDVAPYFKRMENFSGVTDPDSDLRGTSGPLHVKNGENVLGTQLYESFIKAGDEAGYGETKDYNGLRQEGCGPMPATIFHSGKRKGERACTAASYLYPNGVFSSMKTPGGKGEESIQVKTNSTAVRLLWGEENIANKEHGNTQPRVVGVECADGNKYYSKQETILCGGPIASPQLLQLSGVGDFEKLSKIEGIDLKLNLPGVGKNLMDHLEVYLQFQCNHDSLQPKLSYFNKLLIGIRWLLFKDGLGATNHFEAAGFLRSRPGIKYPDIQLHFLPVALSYDGVTSPDTTTGHSFQLHVGCNRSKSRGEVNIRSSSIEEEPEVNFNYMSLEEDWVDFRRAIRLAREIISQPSFSSKYEPLEVTPGLDKASSDEGLDAWLKEELESAYHPCGTCKMGNPLDPTSVVNSEGQVIGLQGIRVVDSSIFPTIPNGNLNSPTIMTAEKMSDAILKLPPLPRLKTQLDHPEGWVDPNWRQNQREKQPLVSHGVE